MLINKNIIYNVIMFTYFLLKVYYNFY